MPTRITPFVYKTPSHQTLIINPRTNWYRTAREIAQFHNQYQSSYLAAQLLCLNIVSICFPKLRVDQRDRRTHLLHRKAPYASIPYNALHSNYLGERRSLTWTHIDHVARTWSSPIRARPFRWHYAGNTHTHENVLVNCVDNGVTLSRSLTRDDGSQSICEWPEMWTLLTHPTRGGLCGII